MPPPADLLTVTRIDLTVFYLEMRALLNEKGRNARIESFDKSWQSLAVKIKEPKQ